MNAKARTVRKPKEILMYLDFIIDGNELSPVEAELEELASMRQALREAIKKKKEAQSRWIESVKEVYEICSAVEKRILGLQYKWRGRYKDKVR